MKRLFPCLAVLFLFPVSCEGEEPAAPAPTLSLVEKAGQEAFRGCAVCHCVTDFRIPEDEDWIVLNRTTRCVSEKENANVRKQIEAYLRSKAALRPLLIDADSPPAEGTRTGSLKMPALAGSAFLKAERDAILRGAPARLRLAWEPEETLRLPAGAYRVVSYIFRSDLAGERWLLTGTGSVNGFADVFVKEGEEGRLELSPMIHGTLSQENAEGGGIMFRYALRDELGATISVSTGGLVRCPEVRVSDKDGKEVHRGLFVNTCGKLSCSWEAGVSGKVSSASVVFDTGPFDLNDAGPVSFEE